MASGVADNVARTVGPRDGSGRLTMSVDPELPDESTATLRSRLGPRALVLVGLMGAGKTTVGKRLAHRLGLSFRDADAEIEEAANMSVADIFAIYGEPAFRDLERRVIARLLGSAPLVLATGGGAYMDGETRERTRRSAVSIWLKADHGTLMRRVRRRTHRPLLQAADPDEVMRRLMDERYPIYAEADLTIETGDGSHDRVVGDVVSGLAAHLHEARLQEPPLHEAPSHEERPR